MIVSFAGSVIVIGLGFVFGMIYRKDKGISGPFATVSLLRNVSLALSVALALAAGFTAYRYFSLGSVINSEYLFEAAESSVEDAIGLMEDFALYGKWLIRCIIAALCALAFFAGCLFTARNLKKKSRQETAAGTAPSQSPESPGPQAGAGQKSENTSAQQEPSSGTVICPKCGTSYDKPVNFCGVCGTKLS
jgi:membrane protease YdiL (CAAX protease family)